MPELPEVETITRKLAPILAGKQILSTDLCWKGSLAYPSPSKFNQSLPNQFIQIISRRGKFLWLTLSKSHLLIHLRMSGDLFIRPTISPSEKHDRVILNLAGDISLVFNDPRKFGRIWLTQTPEQVLKKLGPEPLEEQFTVELLQSMLKNRHRQLKPLLLDQSFLAGLGNIYTDEALFKARLHPLRISDSLSASECTSLWTAIRDVLKEGILRNGASIDWVYKGGDFQNHFKVYGRKGESCHRCESTIEKISVGQRGTHFCPTCQPKGN